MSDSAMDRGIRRRAASPAGSRFDPAQAEDADLVARIGEGCERSLRTLFRRWGPRLGSFLARATGSRETGEDLLQETFLRIVRAAPSFRPRGETRAWIYRIASNLVYSNWRREQARPLTTLDPGHPVLQDLPSSRWRPDRIRARHAFREEAERAVERLPPNQRLVFLLKIGQELTYEEIAMVMRCPIGTAKSRFHFAVRTLRRDLQRWNPAELAEEGESGVV